MRRAGDAPGRVSRGHRAVAQPDGVDARPGDCLVRAQEPAVRARRRGDALADSGGDALKDPAVARALLGPLLQKWESGVTIRRICTSSWSASRASRWASVWARRNSRRRCSAARWRWRAARSSRATRRTPLTSPTTSCARSTCSPGSATASAPAPPRWSRRTRTACAGDREAVTDAESPGVRRSAFALVGDVAKAPGAAAHLAPMLAHIVDAAAANLEPAMVQAWNMGACNNACWSAGEMAMAFPPETLAPHAPRLAAAFLPRAVANHGAGRSGRTRRSRSVGSRCGAPIISNKASPSSSRRGAARCGAFAMASRRSTRSRA